MRRLVIIALAVVLCLCGCSKKTGKPGNDDDQNVASAKDSKLSLAYNSTDSFNPYAAKSDVNRMLCTLLYDSLIKVDSAYEPVNCLAEQVVTNGNTCTVTIRQALFSDGSNVTADDVVYSFLAAKNSSGRYSSILKSIIKAEKTGDKTICFTSGKSDPYIANLLTFPVIKVDSDKLKNADNVSLPPIGCGRYILDLNGEKLTANEKWQLGPVEVKTVRLINAPGEEALSHVIDIGAIDMYYTNLDDCNILRMSGGRTNINLNNLVFIGVNLENEMLSNVYFRQAISAALNRSKICEDAYFTNAVAATGVFNPAWKAVAGIQTILPGANGNITIENLNKIGYNNKNNEGYFVNSAGYAISVKLLVNEENQFRSKAADMIASHLASVGIKVEVEKVGFEKFKERLANRQFELYLAETNILDNMDVSELLCSGGSVAYGIKSTDSDKKGSATEDSSDNADSALNLEGVVKGFYEGRNTISDIAAIAISEMPIIPVCYRTGILFCSDDIESGIQAYEGDIYASVDKLNIN